MVLDFVAAIVVLGIALLFMLTAAYYAWEIIMDMLSDDPHTRREGRKNFWLAVAAILTVAFIEWRL